MGVGHGEFLLFLQVYAMLNDKNSVRSFPGVMVFEHVYGPSGAPGGVDEGAPWAGSACCGDGERCGETD